MSDTEQITELLHAYIGVLATDSLPNLLSLYTSDGVLMAPGYEAAVGAAELTKSYERIFSTIKIDAVFSIHEIVITSPEWAFARTTAEGTKTWLKQRKEEPHWNQELFVLQKVEGVWKIARYAFSSMKPLV